MENIKLLEKAMQVKKRADGTEFTCFADKAPKELLGLFLDHYEVRDLDYQIFAQAIDTVVEAYENNKDGLSLLQAYIQENYSDFASPYNSDRLAYLNVWNDSDVMEIAKNYGCDTISQACAIWYDEQVKDACYIIIKKFLTKE